MIGQLIHSTIGLRPWIFFYHFCISNFKFPQLFTHLINVTIRSRLFRIQFHLRILNVQFYLFTRFASFLLVLDSIVVPFLFLYTQHDHMELAIFFKRPIRNHRNNNNGDLLLFHFSFLQLFPSTKIQIQLDIFVPLVLLVLVAFLDRWW